MSALTTRRRGGPRREALTAAKNTIIRATGSFEEGGLRVEWKRLDAEEQHELVKLTNQATEGPGINVDRLGNGKRKRWEALVERGADADGLFARTREELSLRARAQELVRRARKPVRRPRWEQEGAVVLPRELFEWLDRPDPILWLDHVGVLVFVLLQLENMKPLVPRGRIEGSGDEATLVVDNRLGVGGKYDPDGRFVRLPERLGHLETNGWLKVDRRGQLLYVRRGLRALKVTKGRAA